MFSENDLRVASYNPFDFISLSYLDGVGERREKILRIGSNGVK